MMLECNKSLTKRDMLEYIQAKRDALNEETVKASPQEEGQYLPELQMWNAIEARVREMTAVEYLEARPTIAAAPVRRGEWKHFEYPFDMMTWITGEFGCAECGGRVVRRTGDNPPNFCPNCGADMRKEEVNEPND